MNPKGKRSSWGKPLPPQLVNLELCQQYHWRKSALAHEDGLNSGRVSGVRCCQTFLLQGPDQPIPTPLPSCSVPIPSFPSAFTHPTSPTILPGSASLLQSTGVHKEAPPSLPAFQQHAPLCTASVPFATAISPFRLSARTRVYLRFSLPMSPKLKKQLLQIIS